ncbi:MAG: hypothetical protein WD824_26200 [Cyclobacteriaceae bacterium]
MTRTNSFFAFLKTAIFTISAALPILFFSSCEKGDPKPVNEEEVITTLEVALVPVGGGIPVNLKFFDVDGEHGSSAPLHTVSGPLKASTTYTATIELVNETVNPHGDISAEVEEEANQHLFCFETDGSIAIEYSDEDENGLPLGLITSWVTGAAGEEEVTIVLRHQAGTKTGQCPGDGETDVEVTFGVTVVD